MQSQHNLPALQDFVHFAWLLLTLIWKRKILQIWLDLVDQWEYKSDSNRAFWWKEFFLNSQVFLSCLLSFPPTHALYDTLFQEHAEWTSPEDTSSEQNELLRALLRIQMFSETPTWLKSQEEKWTHLIFTAFLYMMCLCLWNNEENCQIFDFIQHTIFLRLQWSPRFQYFTGTCNRIHSKWILNDRKLLVQKNLIYDKTHHFKVNPVSFIIQRLQNESFSVDCS